ncbi:MAG TPA: C40 family peptidase [Rudaea sp.]|jgi:cell wall-associated NlpC family hydrolase|nr:C40 family peptidase [Rudaea sp.]
MRPSILLRFAAIALLLTACSHIRPKPDIPVSRGPNPLHHHGEQAANDVLFRAIGLVGTPYRYGGNTPEGGFDCSGLIGYVFRDVAGVNLPRTSAEISRLEAQDVKRGDLASGDIVLFGRGHAVNHVGIYVGAGRFVHAPNEGGTVRLDYLDGAYWKDHFSGAKRIPL